MDSRPPAIVFSSMVTGLGVIRSLGQAGVAVIALDPNPLAPGLHSRYTSQSLVCPDSLKSEKAFVDFLVGLGKGMKQKPVLFPTSDTYVPVLARAHDTLKPLFHLPQYDEQNVGILTDKRQQYQEVQRLGIPVPRTYVPESVAEVHSLSEKLRYPMVLKPAHSRSFFVKYGIKGYLTHSPEELIQRYEGYSRAGDAMVMQEYIPGGAQSNHGFHTCCDEHAHPLCRFVSKRIVLEPPIFDIGLVVQRAEQAQVADLGCQVVHGLGLRHYIGNPQFKYDSRDKQWKFLELNPRPPMPISLVTGSGVNLPFMAYQQFLGRPLPNNDLAPQYVTWVLDFTSPNGYRKMAATFLLHRKRHFQHTVFAFFSADDPKPFFYALMVGLQETRNKLTLGRFSG